MEREEKHETFGVAASFKNGLPWSDTVLERDPASHWRRKPVALSAQRRTTETKCKSSGRTAEARWTTSSRQAPHTFLVL